ncbi:MAG: hypothetical protein Kow0092_33820 [Deferrisomatales bacterium]
MSAVSPASSLRIYPEREWPREGWLDRAAGTVGGFFAARLRSGPGRFARVVEAVGRAGKRVREVPDRKVPELARELGARLRREGLAEEAVVEAFALVREVAERAVGLRPFDVQVLGGWVLLGGRVAEMETGEGKTLTATLPASTAALAGIPVHVVTVNDYLAARDAETMGPVYRALGLRVGTVVHGMEAEEKRRAYRCDVTYCTNKEVAFDYLRDRILLGTRTSRLRLQLERLHGEEARTRKLLLRGLYFAIVDEADSVLVDEARTPLIIAGAGDAAEEREVYEQALACARKLVARDDYRLRRRERAAELTERGKGRLRELTGGLGPARTGPRRSEELVSLALVADRLYERDRDYLVREGKVQIVDEFTGRVMGDRSWEQGLHQVIEVKEGCPVTPVRDTVARISYQRFFRRYQRLAGMTGTAREVAEELWAVYGLRVVTVPTNRPLRRVGRGQRVFATAEGKWRAVVEAVAARHREGRPVLVGTRSVEASEHLSRRLQALGLPHVVLNARQDRDEARIVAEAGAPGRITVATNMAGRGTDIRLAPGVAEAGGLHVIATELHEARRIDRQLFGRCGRQGDPGTYEALVSLEDELARLYLDPVSRGALLPLAAAGGAPASRLGGALLRRAQRRAERIHARARRDLLRLDERLGTALAFTGRLE